MADLFAEFNKRFKTAMQGAGTKDIPEKYLNAKKLYTRFLPMIQNLKREGFKRGLDFGCGVGMTSVLGKMMGLHITGIDIPKYSDGSPNPYHVVHSNLADQGYDIRIMDTSVIPWKNCETDEFDFMLSYCSIGKNNLLRDKGSDFNQDEWVNRRLFELARITKNGGSWYLGPKTALRFVRNNKRFKSTKKRIILKSW